MSKFKIGIFTSAWDQVAWDLVKEVYQNVKSGLIPNTEISFVFVSREEGETSYGDLMINNVRKLKLPLITFPSARFKPELRKKDKDVWQSEHDREVQGMIPSTDIIILLGYMWVFGKEIPQTRDLINLHPALPDGPKGTYREVIWQLIENKASETGVMIHSVAEVLDKGPTIAFCRFLIRGDKFDLSWLEMEERLKKESLQKIAKKEGENNILFKVIREEGVKREFPMIVWTTKVLAEGKIKIRNNQVFDEKDQILEDGYDLTSEIDKIIRKEVK